MRQKFSAHEGKEKNHYTKELLKVGSDINAKNSKNIFITESNKVEDL